MHRPSEPTPRAQLLQRLGQMSPNFGPPPVPTPTVPEAAFIPQNLEALDVRT